MKQKLKEKINVGDKVKKPSFQKCAKMSKENENLKSGVLNGDSVVISKANHIQQQQQQQQKLNNNNNSNVDRETTTKAIVGGRLQFYKGKKNSLKKIIFIALSIEMKKKKLYLPLSLVCPSAFESF